MLCEPPPLPPQFFDRNQFIERYILNMNNLINKDGLTISNNSKAIHEELFRGTGSVMGSGASIFMQNESITEKFIITSKDNGLEPTTDQRFVAGRYKEALALFQKWLKA
jgi:hypothetical protein